MADVSVATEEWNSYCSGGLVVFSADGALSCRPGAALQDSDHHREAALKARLNASGRSQLHMYYSRTQHGVA
jgi:hypothetical protein